MAPVVHVDCVLRIMYKWLLALLPLLLVSPTGSVASSLEEAMAKTLKNNSLIKARMYKNLANAKGIFAANAGGLLPRISYNFNYRTDRIDSSMLDRGSGISSITLVQPLVNGPALLSLRKSKYLLEAQEVEFMLERQSVLLGVVKTYMGVLTAAWVYKLNESNRQIVQKHLLAAEKRFSVGEITRTEVLQAKARLSVATSDTVSARGKFKALEASYFHMVGEPPSNLQYPTKALSLPKSVNEVLEAAKLGNLSLKAAQFAYQAAKQDIAIAAVRFLPTLDLKVSRTLSGSLNRNVTEAVVGLSFPFFEQGTGILLLQQSSAAKQHSMYSYREALQRVEESTSLEWENLLTSQAVLQSAKDSVKYAEVALEAIQKEASLNLRTTLEVMDAEQELLKAKVNMVNAKGSLVVAQYNLLALIGQFNIN